MKLRITFEQEVPDVSATTQEIHEWVDWIVRHNHSISLSNPLCNAEIDAEVGSVEYGPA